MKQIIVDNHPTKYFITENGECYNSISGKYLKGQISNSGYLNYNLTFDDGTKRRLYAHRLVAIAYIPNPNNLPEVNHKDGNKLNNNLENLEWMTHSENNRYNTLINNNKNAVPVYQFDKDKNLVASYLCISDAAKAGFTLSMIRQEVKKPIKTLTSGYYWNDSPSSDFEVQNYENIGKAKTVGRYNKQTLELEAIYPSTGQAAKDIGGTHSHISECCRGKIKSYKGYIWKYIEE